MDNRPEAIIVKTEAVVHGLADGRCPVSDGMTTDLTQSRVRTDTDTRNSQLNAAVPAPGVSRAGSSATSAWTPTPPAGHDMAKSDRSMMRARADTWTLGQKLEFFALWLALELSDVEIAIHFGLSDRHLRRLRVEFGLEERRVLQKLSRAARQRLATHEALAGFMSQEGQALLKVSQDRRRIQEEARRAAAVTAARRNWGRRQVLQEPADARYLRKMLGRRRRSTR